MGYLMFGVCWACVFVMFWLVANHIEKLEEDVKQLQRWRKENE
jgi:hypothetical protein